MGKYYIASCVFTAQFPALSERICAFVRDRYGLSVVRCCTPRYKVREFEEKMPAGSARDRWRALPESADFQAGDEIVSLCHNCNNVIEESCPGTRVRSLWELLDEDGTLEFPDHGGETVTVQDCWRSRDREREQRAVRSLLKNMGFEYRETVPSFAETDFCGVSLYRPQPPRNPALAPRHYADGAAGLFQPHTPEEQRALMEAYCRRYTTHKVVCYCHYCLEGLLLGGVEGIHLAHLLFPAG
ncbi:MAG: hypothetical protein J6Z79_07045 [Clostridia bacterium]|nr:hypothetical protein [Clostridia bacterium]